MQSSVDQSSLALVSEFSQRSRSVVLKHAVYAALATASMCAPWVVGTAQEAPAAEEAAAESSDDVTKMSDMSVTEDPLRAMSNDPSASSFGFAKPLLETPRTVSFVSEEQIRLFGISTVEDLSRVVPGTFTTTRYGLQGGVQVRGVASDYYFRGMKRLSMQGHARTVLSAMDNIEVVKGPPSPIFGMGKIGGFVNLDPKSSRAKTGKYLTGASGYAQGVVGSYDRTEMSFGAGGPFKIMDKTGGFYVYSLLEDSNTYVEQVSVTQRFLQATASVDEFIGPFRLDLGGQAQQSITAGAYMNRVTQDLIDSGNYITGMPLVNLDFNGDGAIGFRERHERSPIYSGTGLTISSSPSTANQALTQRFNWPVNASGVPLPFGQWPAITGIPETMKNHLSNNAAGCPAWSYMAGLPAAVPNSSAAVTSYPRQLPAGFALNPCGTGYTQVDYRRNGAYEEEQNARQMLLYLDLSYDVNPDFTIKNQLFYDLLDSFKDSYLPYGENQQIHAFEEKITVTKRIPDSVLPQWLRVNALASANYRRTSARIISSGGDFDMRQDVMYREGELTPNTSFWTQLNNPNLATGALATRRTKSTFDEMGAGTMFDIDIARNTNVLLGARYDFSNARAQEKPDFIETASLPGSTGTNVGVQCAEPNLATACRAVWLTADDEDEGASWSASLSHQLPWLGMRPYATLANSSLTLDAANNLLTPSVITAPGGHIGEAELKEVGIKSSMFRNKVQVTVAGYEQSRTDVSAASDPTAGAEVSSTIYRGVEADIKWQPTRDLFMSVFGVWQSGEYTVAGSANIDITARQAGFQDVRDATGNVIYPAEAFFYGGRVNVTLPASLADQYKDRTGTPNTQLGYTGTYQIGKGFGILANGQYFSATWSDRLKTIRAPSATIWNAGITWDQGDWHVKLNGYNIFDKRYFRARSSDTGLGVISAMPTARWEMTLKVDF
jgi:iron complex outermembrane receptor protein